MEILPAIDIRGGKAVRLAMGDYARQTTYNDDPQAVAEQFIQAGARWIHIVDLDAAKSGELTNTAIIARIAKLGAQVELGGGIRTDAVVDRMLGLGIARLVIGSAALADWPWFEALATRGDLAGRLALGLDARDGQLAVHGWTKQVQLTAVEVAKRVVGLPLGAIVYTDISRDGMLSGVNLESTAAIIAASRQDVIASGGVRDIEDVHNCRRIGCSGMIVGKAWYEGRIDLPQALAAGRA